MGITSLILVVLTAICMVGAMKKPYLGILGYLIVYSTYNSRIWYAVQFEMVFIRPSFAASIILIVGCLINYHQLSWSVSRREMEFYAFIIIMFIVSYFFGVGVEEDNWFYLEKILKTSVFLFFLFRSIITLNQFKSLQWVLIGGAVFLTLQSHQIGGYHGGRLNNIGGTDFGEANGLAAYLTVGMIFIGFKLLQTKSLWKKALLILPIPFILNAIIMTQSRAVFLGIALAGVYLLLKSPWRVKKEVSLYGVLAVILFFNLAHDQFWDRMGTIEGQASLLREEDVLMGNSQGLSRVDYWKASLDIFRDHPMGIGVKNFSKIVSFYDPRNPGMDAHNTYVLCYSEIGILGISLFLLILGEGFLGLNRIVKTAKKSSELYDFQMISLGFLTIFVMYFLGPNMTHSYLYSEFLWILLALPICLENALRNHQYQKEA